MTKHKRRSYYEDHEMGDVFRKHNLHWKRMISGSKSGYRGRYPKHDVIFNANFFTPSGIWWNADLDITKDNHNIQQLCNELNEEIIITHEMIGWNGAEDKSYDELKEHAHAIFTPNENEYLRRVYEGIHAVKDGKMTIITSKGVDWKKIVVEKFYEDWQHNPENDVTTDDV